MRLMRKQTAQKIKTAKKAIISGTVKRILNVTRNVSEVTKLYTKIAIVALVISTSLVSFTNAATAPAISLGSPVLLIEPTENSLDKAIPASEQPEATGSFYAIVTQYSYADSCHNVVDGKCLMASGRAVYVGAVACPRFLPLGSKVQIDGKNYTCEDRYATWVDTKRGMPTIDIFVANNPAGNSVKVVTTVK